MKLARTLVVLAAGAGVAWYVTRDEAQRRYLRGVAKQIPHLPGRYAV